MAVVAKKTDAQKIAELRKAAEDKTLPQAVRNAYLDRANEIERAGYEKMKMQEGLNMAKGGKVSSKAKAKPSKPAMAVMIGLSPAKKMAKGGDMKMGYAKGGMAMVEKDGKMVPSFAADGVGKMAKGGKVPAAISEYGGKEKYASKAAMMKHEKKESPKMEKKEKEMAKGGTVKCATGGAVKKKPMKGVINKFV
jgi:hypothetical protein